LARPPVPSLAIIGWLAGWRAGWLAASHLRHGVRREAGGLGGQRAGALSAARRGEASTSNDAAAEGERLDSTTKAQPAASSSVATQKKVEEETPGESKTSRQSAALVPGRQCKMIHAHDRRCGEARIGEAHPARSERGVQDTASNQRPQRARHHGKPRRPCGRQGDAGCWALSSFSKDCKLFRLPTLPK
jgi:hypothetical protein